MVKVVFIPSSKSKNSKLKGVEYFVDSDVWSEAINKAKAQLKIDNELWRSYRCVIATTVKVI